MQARPQHYSEQKPEKNSGSEWDSNSLPLRVALHRHRRGRGFESRSEPEFFSGLCSSSAAAALALVTYMSCIYSPYNMYSDWPILTKGIILTLCPRAHQGPTKTKQKAIQ